MRTQRGPVAARAALVEAATELFAAKGNASLREVAQRAGVNHGLVHHYLGGKRGLRTAVLDHLASAFDTKLELDADADMRTVAYAAIRAVDSDDRYVKILARTLLDDALPDQLQTRFPFVSRLTATVDSAVTAQAKAVLAQGLALSFGVAVFGPWICAALGLEPEQLRAIRDDALERAFATIEAGETSETNEQRA